MARSPSFQYKFDEQLIDLVHQYRVIWDPSRKSCRDRVMRDNAWKEIAAMVNRSDKECRIRWRTIRDSYKKVKKIIKESGASESRSKYRKMDNLKFLDGFDDGRRSMKSACEVSAITVKMEQDVEDVIEEGELPHDDDDDDYNDDVLENTSDTSFQHDSKDAFNDNTARTVVPVNGSDQKKVPSNGIGEPLQNIVLSREERMDTVPRDPSQEAENHVYTFFRSMAQSVSTFPEHLIIETKLSVCQLISEMEMKALMERSNYGRPS